MMQQISCYTRHKMLMKTYKFLNILLQPKKLWLPVAVVTCTHTRWPHMLHRHTSPPGAHRVPNSISFCGQRGQPCCCPALCSVLVGHRILWEAMLAGLGRVPFTRNPHLPCGLPHKPPKLKSLCWFCLG